MARKRKRTSSVGPGRIAGRFKWKWTGLGQIAGLAGLVVASVALFVQVRERMEAAPNVIIKVRKFSLYCPSRAYDGLSGGVELHIENSGGSRTTLSDFVFVGSSAESDEAAEFRSYRVTDLISDPPVSSDSEAITIEGKSSQVAHLVYPIHKTTTLEKTCLTIMTGSDDPLPAPFADVTVIATDSDRVKHTGSARLEGLVIMGEIDGPKSAVWIAHIPNSLTVRVEGRDLTVPRLSGDQGESQCDRMAALSVEGKVLIDELRQTKASYSTRRQIDQWYWTVCAALSKRRCGAFLSASPKVVDWPDYPADDKDYSQTLTGRSDYLAGQLTPICR